MTLARCPAAAGLPWGRNHEVQAGQLVGGRAPLERVGCAAARSLKIAGAGVRDGRPSPFRWSASSLNSPGPSDDPQPCPPPPAEEGISAPDAAAVPGAEAASTSHPASDADAGAGAVSVSLSVSASQVASELQRLREALASLSSAALQVMEAVDALSASLPPPPLDVSGPPPLVPVGPWPAAQGRSPPAPGSSSGATAAAAGGGGGDKAGGREVSIPGLQSEVAVRLLQAYVQAKVEGMGKPPEVALEDFVDVCMEAEVQGTGFMELQLQLILAEGSLPPPFGRTAQSAGEESEVQLLQHSEDVRARNSWVRFVYTTLAMVRKIKAGEGYTEVVSPDQSGLPDPIDGFVQQTVCNAIENGMDLDFVLQQQKSAPGQPLDSPFIRLMRQGQVLILMAFSKGMAAC